MRSVTGTFRTSPGSSPRSTPGKGTLQAARPLPRTRPSTLVACVCVVPGVPFLPGTDRRARRVRPPAGAGGPELPATASPLRYGSSSHPQVAVVLDRPRPAGRARRADPVPGNGGYSEVPTSVALAQLESGNYTTATVNDREQTIDITLKNEVDGHEKITSAYPTGLVDRVGEVLDQKKQPFETKISSQNIFVS